MVVCRRGIRGGLTVVNVFFAKDGFDVPGPAHPRSNIENTFPDGKKVTNHIFGEKGKKINAAKDRCNVQIGTSSLQFKDGKYYLYYEDDIIKYHVIMESTLPMWRPHTGHWNFGKENKDFFAWFVAQPASIITGILELKEKLAY